MKTGISTFLLLFAFSSCSTMDLHIKESALSSKPGKILIGFFEKRNMKYEPFFEKNFRDSLRFQFFQLGYNAIVIKPDRSEGNKQGKHDLSSEGIKKIMSRYGGDLFIQGAISEMEIGDIADNKTSTTVIFQIYNKSGEIAGEAQCITSDTIVDASVRNEVTKSFVEKLHDEFK